MTIKQRDNLIYGGIALGSLVFLLWVIPAYTPPYPGYGVSSALVPNVAMGIILLLSVVSLIKNFAAHLKVKAITTQRAKHSQGDQAEVVDPEKRVHLLHLAKFMIPSVFLMPGIQLVGFIPAGIVFMLIIQLLCGQRKPLPLVLVSVITVVTLYAVMTYGLSVPMP